MRTEQGPYYKAPSMRSEEGTTTRPPACALNKQPRDPTMRTEQVLYYKVPGMRTAQEITVQPRAYTMPMKLPRNPGHAHVTRSLLRAPGHAH